MAPSVLAPAATLPLPQAIQSRDRIQLQYSQSLIEKDQYRKQVRGLEAERDELLTTLTSLEGAKALLEAQLQRVQGGPCLKVSGVQSPRVLVGTLGLRREWEPLVGAGVGWRIREQDGRGGSLSFWGGSCGTRDGLKPVFACTWRSLAA